MDGRGRNCTTGIAGVRVHARFWARERCKRAVGACAVQNNTKLGLCGAMLLCRNGTVVEQRRQNAGAHVPAALGG